ncbi:MAG: penicillin-binding protein 2 [Patescibacteria group bacterium]|nr:penicillin-binding protein 2 [Patescibacteria group bacterium]
MKSTRLLFLLFFLSLCFFAVLTRFFYWQVIAGDKLSVTAQKQRFKTVEVSAPRGKIYAFDDYPLVLNKNLFFLYVYLPNCPSFIKELPEKLSPIFVSDFLSKESSPSANLDTEGLIKEERVKISQNLSSGKKWVILKRRLSLDSKKEIEDLGFNCLSFESESFRDYPEGSMSAQLLGFVGFDKNGNQKGYFGLEGFYNQQLSGLPGLMVEEKTLIGRPIFSEKRVKESVSSGMNLNLYSDRVAQFILEEELKKGIDIYGAASGWGVILDPVSGGILAMAGFPNYDPANYTEFTGSLFSNPAVSEGFEPGSIFKPLIMTAALEEEVLTPETKCDRCAGPRKIGDYNIKTWNEKYHPHSTMTEVIQNSDNVGMVFVSEKLGKERLLDWLKKFGFGEKTGIDLQGEAALPIRSDKDWYPIDLATVSFGQGILVTPIQLTRAFSVLANQGWLIKPKVVQKIWLGDKDVFLTEESGEKRIISPKVSEEIKKMLINAVENGEAKNLKPARLVIAGKTGTAQIPISGHYDQEKTIASFIGFTPADNPKFVMLISLREPSSSPWGSETAAPVWFNIANRLAYYWQLF